MTFLDQLNSSQREAVTCTEGASLVVAGAGSGKTRVLTYRIAYLLQQGVPASRIMALTFTNKAAREMKERIVKLVGDEARYLMMGTFHSVCVRLLRPYAEVLGFTHDFSIYDTPDMKSVIKGICKEMKLDEEIYKPNAVLHRISEIKNGGITPSQYGLNKQLMNEDRMMRMYDFAVVYERYQNRLKLANAMDFDDLLIQTINLIDNNIEARRTYQQQFQYILVDEYQDTNYVQFLLTNRLAAPQNNICVVGDDAQSIYSFRGADIRNILNFRQQYPEAKLFKLERNYRSTQNIVNAANSLIQKNLQQIRKTIYSEKEIGAPLKLQAYSNEHEEAEGVAKQIFKLQNEGYGASDIAILYRTNAQSRVLENELSKFNIASRIYGGTSFYQRKEVKDALSYLRIAINLLDNEALLRIVGFPSRGIGKNTMDKVAAQAITNNCSYLEVMRNPDKAELNVNATTKKKLQEFVFLIDGFHAQRDQMNAYEFADMVFTLSGLRTALAIDDSPEGIDREENVLELLTAIHEFVELKKADEEDSILIADFLSEVSLLTDQDVNIDGETECVTLSTVHAAKGLEFPIVFIVGLEEDLFPSHLCITPKEIEEERRLLYVAITRSMEQCYLSYACWRFRNGNGKAIYPSRFLSDINRCYMNIHQRGYGEHNVKHYYTYQEPAGANRIESMYSKAQEHESTLSKPAFTTPVTENKSPVAPLSSPWKEGDRVSHRVFGIGTVVRVYRDEVTENDKIEIHFDTQGTKTLLLTHAKLEKI